MAGRKDEHLRVVLEESVAHRGVTTGLERLRLNARALPELDLDRVSLSVRVFGRDVAAPVLISCMTGGSSEAGRVNTALAAAAAHHGVALGLGSGRVLLEGGDPGSFQVRRIAPNVPLLANLGAVQLAQVGVDGCRRLVALTEADVLVLHLNAVQEAIQPGGDTEFSGLLDRMTELVALLEVPVVVKEVGFGLSPEDVSALWGTGVAGVDVAGAGGTNWATVEGHRDHEAGQVAAAFADWGWSTVESLGFAVAGRPEGGTVIASGGLADGVDAVKCLALGADLAGFGRRLLPAAAAGPDEATAALGVLIRQMRVATWGVGAATVGDLGPTHVRTVE